MSMSQNEILDAAKKIEEVKSIDSDIEYNLKTLTNSHRLNDVAVIMRNGIGWVFVNNLNDIALGEAAITGIINELLLARQDIIDVLPDSIVMSAPKCEPQKTTRGNERS